jgi:thiol-disulfide isomerase/thioredoxin
VSKRGILALFVGVAFIAAAGGYAVRLWSGSGDGGAARSLEVDSRAAAEVVFAARLSDLNGGNQTLEQWRGRVLVVNFWATWCAPCREEIPEFVRMQERYRDQGLQFVGIAIDQRENVAAFAREFSINYPLLLGGVDAMELARQAGNRGGVLPFTLIIDRAGSIAGREPGGLKEARLESLIRPLI